MINCSKFVCSKNKEVSTARQCWPVVTFLVNCSNLVEPGLTGFKQLINFVSSSWFPAHHLIVEQSNFEQFTPTPNIHFILNGNQINSKKFWQNNEQQIITNNKIIFHGQVCVFNQFKKYFEIHHLLFSCPNYKTILITIPEQKVIF